MKSLIRKSDDQELHLCVSSLGTAAATTRTSQVNGKDREWGNSLDAGQIPPLLLACLFCFTPITFLQSEI